MGRWILRLVTRLTPEGFRTEFADELCEVADEQWAALRAKGAGPTRRALFWLRQWSAVLRAGAELRRADAATMGTRMGGMTMDGFVQDLRLAMRGLIKRPGFSLLTILTLGLGIGATTAVFSAVNTVVLRPLPYRDAERVAVLFRTDAVSGERSDGVSAANIRDFRDAATLFEDLAVAEPWSLDLQVDGRMESLRTWTVTRGFFDAIGGEPLLGRTFTDEDYDDGAAIVILSHRSWSNRFSADPGILGQPLALDGQALTVVGIMPPEFRFPDAAEMWIPRTDQPWDEDARAADFMTGVGRLASTVSLPQARAEAGRVTTVLEEAHPEINRDLAYTLVPLSEHLFGDVQAPLFVIMAAVAFVLLIACANVAGLMLARGAQRERDYALRGALGAGTGRLVGHVVAESLILAAVGCVVGVAITYGGVAVIQVLGPDHLPRIDQIGIDGPVLAFAAVAAGLSAVLSGLAPSLRLSRPDLRAALGDGSRGTLGERFASRARGRLVITQVAGAVVLLTGAGLLLRSFGVLLDKELGFDPSDRVAVQIFAYDYESNEDRDAMLRQAVESMEALPGVTGVAMTTNLPGATDGVIANIDTSAPFTVANRAQPPEGQEPTAALVQVSAGYFDVMDIDVIAGREFDATDTPDAAQVIVISESLARRHFGDADPVGEQLNVDFGQNTFPREIIGVVRDTRPLGHASQPRPEIYRPLTQSPSGSLTFVVESEAEAAALTLPVMEAIWSANPAQSVYGATTVEALMSEWLKERRFNLFLISAFSLIALLLSAIGLYGLVSFSVERRRGELGIRRALGGQSSTLLGMVVREGARLVAIGLAIGLAASWYLSRFIQSMLFEVEPTDPLTLGSLGLLVFVIAGLATLVPALRATRIDPVEALRSE